MENMENRKSVLVVEDDPGIAEICQRILNAAGFDVDAAANGKIACSTLDKKEYDLYIVDIRMPEMNGIELHQNMTRTHAKLANRVLFISGDTLSWNIKESLEESQRPYISKPFTPDELRNAVKTAIDTN
jgi:DNA-binding response OmpR family regulator